MTYLSAREQTRQRRNICVGNSPRTIPYEAPTERYSTETLHRKQILDQHAMDFGSARRGKAFTTRRS